MRTHSVERRFTIIVSAALLLLITPLFLLFFNLSAERAAKEEKERVITNMVASVQALGKPLWDFDTEAVRKVARTLFSDPKIKRIQITDTSGAIDITIPGMLSASSNTEHLTTVSSAIHYQSVDGIKTVGTLNVSRQQSSFFQQITWDDIAILAIFLLAVSIIFATAIVANRLTVIRPLLALTDAIVATRDKGSRHEVNWTSNDEMGVLASNFNEMQKELAREELHLKSAHEFVQNLYNQTPAMLYSLDARGRIAAVSDYWLLATGYERERVIGKPFTDFLAPSARVSYRRRSAPNPNGTASPGVTVKFVCSDGKLIDVLIRETISTSDEGQPVGLSVMTDVTELKEAEHRNHIQAITDHLTGLLNRQGFETRLDDKIAEAEAHGLELACLFVDLDRFKWVNDNMGHASGDIVLREVVSRMSAQLRPNDTVARLGGDEFAILILAQNAKLAATEVAERITNVLGQPFDIPGASAAALSASVGIALFPEHARTASELLQKSDMAMYARKRSGKNGTKIFNRKMSEETERLAEMERNIELGLANDWFETWLQPVVDLKTGEIHGFESLMRLRHPQKGILPPADIIAAAEENGSICAIGDVILEKSIAALKRINDLPGLGEARVGVNFSPLQFNAHLPVRIAELLLKEGLSPSRLVVEVTEAVFMQNNPEIEKMLKAFSEQGMSVALDDFGTGYSSLSYLHNFPVKLLKIDKSFISSLTDSNVEKRDRAHMLVQGIVTLGQQLGCLIVGEGIEDATQANILRSMGADNGQGYYFAKPMPLEDVVARYSAAPLNRQIKA